MFTSISTYVTYYSNAQNLFLAFLRPFLQCFPSAVMSDNLCLNTEQYSPQNPHT